MLQIIAWSFDFVLRKSSLLHLNHINLSYYLASSSCSLTAWIVPKDRVFLICIFPYVGRIVSDFSCFWIEYPVLSKYGKIQIRFCPYTGKYCSEKARILACFTQSLAEHFQSKFRATRKNKFCQCAKIIGAQIFELFNYVKLKTRK